MITALADEYPILRKKREIFVGALFSFYMFVGIPSCTQGGYYIVELFNNYSATYSIIVAVIVENIAVAWFYGRKKIFRILFLKFELKKKRKKGTERFCNDIKEMIGYYPNKFWVYCWKYITPSCLSVNSRVHSNLK